jgi:hypothetical protein
MDDAHLWAWPAKSQPLLLAAHKMPERFWIPGQTYAADGGARPNSGGAPFRQPCPAYPATKGWQAPQERFSEEVSGKCRHPETGFSKAQLQIYAHTAAQEKLAAHSKPGCTRGTH